MSIFRDVLMFYQTFLLPQMKRSAIISNAHFIYEFPQELPNVLRILRNYPKESFIDL